MGKLIDFIKKKNIKEFEISNILFDLNDEISEELSGKFSENGVVPDELYLGAEFMSDVGMKALYNICYNLVLRRYGQPYNCDFKKEFNIFEKELSEDSVCKEFLHTARDEKNYKTKSTYK